MMTFKELEVGDKFKCKKDKGKDMVYIKRKKNNTINLLDNSLCTTNHISCFIPDNTIVFKVEEE